MSTNLPDPKNRPTLSVDEVADLLGLDRKTVYASVSSGEIPSLRVGRRILVPTRWLADLDESAGNRAHDLAL